MKYRYTFLTSLSLVIVTFNFTEIKESVEQYDEASNYEQMIEYHDMSEHEIIFTVISNK